MNTREKQEEELFHAARQLTDPRQRAAFLEAACHNDADLRGKIDGLLASQPEVEAFFEASAPTPRNQGTGLAKQTAPPPVDEATGTLIGSYQLQQKIGEGGFGVVYLADQKVPVKRCVALKIIKLGMATQQVVARFEAERQALALMEHPNIAKVFDAGATESGRPYFVMELVRGEPITQYCEQHNLAPVERLNLFIQVCRAIQHAHQKGIIHRDIKPSNILVTRHDGVPVPKVIDFGIAKATQQELTEQTLFTQFHQFMGTPAYMSPEQTERSGVDIDTRSDIYSLGVLLYELLTGKTPFDGKELLAAGLDEMRRIIREKEPVRPSTRLTQELAAAEVKAPAAPGGPSATEDEVRSHSRRRLRLRETITLLRGDLDWIVMKALEKDRTRRYETANGLALDLQRHLESEPVEARPPSRLYRFQKFARRNKLTLAAVAAITAVLVLGVVVSLTLAIQATRAVREQNRLLDLARTASSNEATQRRRAERNLYAADMKQAKRDVDIDDLGHALELLNKHRPKAGQAGPTNQPAFEWRHLWKQCQGDPHAFLPPVQGIVWWLEYSPTGNYLAAAVEEEVVVFDMNSRTAMAHLDTDATSRSGSRWAMFTPDGKTLITANHDRVKFYDTTRWAEQPLHFPPAGGPIALSPDGTSLVTMADNERPWSGRNWKTARIWNLGTLEVSRTLTNVDGPPAFSPDGKYLATDAPAGITLWPIHPASGAVLVLQDSSNLFAHPSGFMALRRSMAYSPNGKFIAAGGRQGRIMLWEAATGRRLDNDKIPRHRNAFTCLAFSRDSLQLATASFDSTILISDINTFDAPRKLRGHLSGVWSLAFAPDGHSLVSGSGEGNDDCVKIWQLDGRPPQEEKDVNDAWRPVWVSTNGLEVMTFDINKAEYWNTDTGRLLYVLPRPDGPPVPPCSFAIPAVDGQSLFAAYSNGIVRMATFASGEIAPLPGGHAGEVTQLAAAPDGSMLVSGGRDANICWWDIASRRLVRSTTLAGAVTALAFSPDAQMLLSASADLQLCWWEVASGRLFASTTLTQRAEEILFSPNGNTLVVGTPGHSQLWDVAARSAKSDWISHWGQISFSPDSRMLVVNGQPMLYDATNGQPIAALTGHKQVVGRAVFSPDGQTIATAGDDGTLRLWNTETQQEMLTFLRMGNFDHVMFSADGRTLVAGSEAAGDGGLRVWHAPSFAEIQAKEKANLHNH